MEKQAVLCQSIFVHPAEELLVRDGDKAHGLEEGTETKERC